MGTLCSYSLRVLIFLLFQKPADILISIETNTTGTVIYMDEGKALFK